MLLGQGGGVSGGGTVDGIWKHVHPRVFHAGDSLATLQPGGELAFAALPNFGVKRQGDRPKHHRQADQGKSVLGDFKEAVGRAHGHRAQPLADFLKRCHCCHSSSFVRKVVLTFYCGAVGGAGQSRLGWYAIKPLL